MTHQTPKPSTVAVRAARPAARVENSKRTIRPTDADIDAMMASLTAPQKPRVDALLAQIQKRTFGPTLKLDLKGDTLDVSYNHENGLAAAALTMADMGTIDSEFSNGLVNQIAGIGSHRKRVDQGNSNFVLSVVRAVQPRDGLEAMLAVQMGAIHSATITLARKLNLAESIPQQDAAERALNKLARTYAMQMEALKRYRSKGEQRVIVERVTINQGGQAIVGSVTRGGADE